MCQKEWHSVYTLNWIEIYCNNYHFIIPSWVRHDTLYTGQATAIQTHTHRRAVTELFITDTSDGRPAVGWMDGPSEKSNTRKFRRCHDQYFLVNTTDAFPHDIFICPPTVRHHHHRGRHHHHLYRSAWCIIQPPHRNVLDNLYDARQ